jgi:gamma-glutamyltranspeptidase/glutathione hydrolase
MARGLFALHVNAGRFKIEDLIRPAEDLARLGTEISRTLADDLAVVAGPLLADPSARQIFGRAGGGALKLGDRITQPDLSATMAQLRASALGIGDLYQGSLAERLVEGSVMSGGGLTEAELRATRIRAGGATRTALGSDLVLLSTDASPGMAGALQAAMAGQTPGADTSAGSGAGASLVTLDREGNAVSCAFSMNNLFGRCRAPAFCWPPHRASARCRLPPCRLRFWHGLICAASEPLLPAAAGRLPWPQPPCLWPLCSAGVAQPTPMPACRRQAEA